MYIQISTKVCERAEEPPRSQTLVLIYIYNTELSIIFSLKKAPLYEAGLEGQRKRTGKHKS